MHKLLGAKLNSPGYHVYEIEKGEIGEISKIVEEVAELIDADAQNIKIMQLVELSDLIGAVESYLEKRHPATTLQDLIAMSNVTKRAFKSGRRS
jgi:hypothetical protein